MGRDAARINKAGKLRVHQKERCGSVYTAAQRHQHAHAHSMSTSSSTANRCETVADHTGPYLAALSPGADIDCAHGDACRRGANAGWAGREVAEIVSLKYTYSVRTLQEPPSSSTLL